ncbi:ATP-dependent zinc protease [soil metagenome]
MKAAESQELITVGWREWIALPEIGLLALRAKLDTGARTSALHATEVERFINKGAPYVRFLAHPLHTPKRRTWCEAPLIDEREITSSNAATSTRLIIQTSLRLGVPLGSPEWDIELSLAERKGMRFPMLLGREALHGRIVVDPGSSFLLGKPVSPADLYAPTSR